ncbi:DUF2336 domain-containing protein [Azospirillaceae bacterium]
MNEGMSDQLTKQDVIRLLSDPSATTRADTAAKVAKSLDKAQLSPGERQLAEDIVRRMARDTALRVRQTLAENLKNSNALPRDVALMLARDVEAVSLPILSLSTVLSDDDLFELVRDGTSAKQSAIANRPQVSSSLAEVIIETAGEETIAVLVANEGAEITENALERVVDRFGESENIQEPLVRRSKLPITIAERLVNMVSERLQEYLVAHHELPTSVASDLVLQTRERATINLVNVNTDEADLEKMVAQMARSGRLGPSILMRALCMGDMAFFETGMSFLAGVPMTNARLLIHDGGSLGLRSIYEKAGMPLTLLPAVRVAIDVFHETYLDGEERDIERHRRRMIERILTQNEDMAAEDIDYLLNKIMT